MTEAQAGFGIKAVYLLVFIYLGAQGNYLPLWLKSAGWSESQTGLVFSLRYLAIIIVPVFWGAYSDKHGASAALRVISIGAILCFSPLLFTNTVLFVTAALTLFAMFRVGIIAVADSLAITHVERFGGDFGRLRQWGSFGFIAGGFLLGGVSQWTGSRDYIPLTLWIILLATAALAYGLPKQGPTTASSDESTASWSSMLSLLRQPKMLRFLGVVLLWRLSSQGLYAMLPLHLAELGVSDSWVAGFWAVGVISEITMFRLAPRWFAPRGQKSVLVLCFVSCIVQYTLLAVVKDHIGVAAIMLLHGLSFGMAYYTCVTWRGDAITPAIRAAGQGLFQVVAFGIGGAISTIAAGLLFEAGAGTLLFSSAATAATITLVAAGVLLRTEDGWSWRGK